MVVLVVSELTSRREIDSTSAPHCQSVPRVDELAATGLCFFEHTPEDVLRPLMMLMLQVALLVAPHRHSKYIFLAASKGKEKKKRYIICWLADQRRAKRGHKRSKDHDDCRLARTDRETLDNWS